MASRLGIGKSCCFAWLVGWSTFMAAPPLSAAAQPDLTGLWRSPFAFTSDKGSDAYDEKDPVLAPPPGPPPEFTPEYAQRTKENEVAFYAASTPKGAGAKFANKILVRRQVQCLPHGMPMTMRGWASLDIIQKPDRVTVIAEFEREVRRIWLDRKLPPLEDVDPGFWGYSVGKWEGDTLVVTTIGIRDDLEGVDFMAHSDRMTITERIRLVRPDVLHDQVTITDPLALKKPWTTTFAMVRLPKSYEPSEYVCDNLRGTVDANGVIHRE